MPRSPRQRRGGEAALPAMSRELPVRFLVLTRPGPASGSRARLAVAGRRHAPSPAAATNTQARRTQARPRVGGLARCHDPFAGRAGPRLRRRRELQGGLRRN